MKGTQLRVFCLFAFTILSVTADPLQLWSTERIIEKDASIRKLVSVESNGNSRLTSVKHAYFFTEISTIFDELKEDREVSFGIPLPNGRLNEQRCFLSGGHPIVPAALAAKFPTLKLFHCVTRNHGELRIVIDKSRVDAFSASFFDGESRKSYYVDNVLKNSDHYVIYDSAIAAKEGIRPKLAGLKDFEEIVKEAPFSPSLSRASDFPAFKFKLAPLANAEYSEFHGNTISSVMAAIIECFSRVNGIYSREMGVFFVLIEDADLGICLDGDNRFACYDLDNDASVIRDSDYILEELGVPYDSYDIGHVLTTGSGGVAYLGSLCSGYDKAGGTTGLPEPYTDVYFVDYVSHEIGHQLYGGHVFRDCRGPNDGNFMSMSAVEPGSGSSIMGYAGICGGNNIQGFSDPYFNNLNLQQMRDFVVERAQRCGERVNVANTVPQLEVPNQCKVPVGSYFQLKGTSIGQTDETSYFSWDRSDTGYEDLDSINLGAFRSWKPTKSTSRFFPNLYTIMYPEYELTLGERVPTVAREMDFRFTERRLYETTAVTENFQTSVMGDFNYADITVEFVDEPNIKIISPSSNSGLSNGESISITWESMSKNVNLEILVAENLIEQSSERFDYEKDIKDLEWTPISSVSSSTGSFTFALPRDFDDKKINIMVRSSLVNDNEGCFYFDIAYDLEVGQTQYLHVYAIIALVGLVFGTGLAFARSYLRRKSIDSEVSGKDAFTSTEQPGSQSNIATRNPMAGF